MFYPGDSDRQWKSQFPQLVDHPSEYMLFRRRLTSMDVPGKLKEESASRNTDGGN